MDHRCPGILRRCSAGFQKRIHRTQDGVPGEAAGDGPKDPESGR